MLVSRRIRWRMGLHRCADESHAFPGPNKVFFCFGGTEIAELCLSADNAHVCCTVSVTNNFTFKWVSSTVRTLQAGLTMLGSPNDR
jgi:hypothetical protein